MISHPLAHILHSGFNTVYEYDQIINRLGNVKKFADYLKMGWLYPTQTDFFNCVICGDPHEWVTKNGVHFKYCPSDPTAPVLKANQKERNSYQLNWPAIGRSLCQTHSLTTLLNQQKQLILLGYNATQVMGLSSATNEQNLRENLNTLRENYSQHRPTLIYSGLFPLSQSFSNLLETHQGDLLIVDRALDLPQRKASRSNKPSLHKRSKTRIQEIKPAFTLNINAKTLHYENNCCPLSNALFETAQKLWESNGEVWAPIWDASKAIGRLRDKLSLITNKEIKSKTILLTRIGQGYQLNTEHYLFEIQS